MSDEPVEKTPTEKMHEHFKTLDKELAEKSKQQDPDHETKDWENKHPKGPK